MKKLRIGGGAGFSGDRIEPAVELVESGELDVIIFECLAERTIALAQQRKRHDPTQGYDPLFEDRMRAVLELGVRNHVKIITNMGAANPQAAGALAIGIAGELGIEDMAVAVVTGDDVVDRIWRGDLHLDGLDLTDEDVQDRLVSANVYLGSEPILEALRLDADLIITGRVADPSLTAAPLMHAFDWPTADWDSKGRAVLLGHLMECGPHISGGYYADPGYKDVKRLEHLGYPILEVYDDGRAFVTKVDGTGGVVSVGTCKEQLLYEIGDPSAVISPDAVADFRDVRFVEVSPNRVEILGCRGRARPEQLRVLLCVHEGYVGEGEISYGGPGAMARAQIAAESVVQRLKLVDAPLSELRIDYIGVNHLYMESAPARESSPTEVRVRVSGRAPTLRDAERTGFEVESLLLNGPSGGGGSRKYVHEVTPMHSAFVDRDAVPWRVQILRPSDAI